MSRVYYDGYGGNGQIIVPKKMQHCHDEKVCHEKEKMHCENERVHCEKEEICCEEEKECSKNECHESEKICCRNEEIKCNNSNSLFSLDSFLPNLALDDIILLAIVLILLHDGTEDKLLLVIVGIVFLLGFDNKEDCRS